MDSTNNVWGLHWRVWHERAERCRDTHVHTSTPSHLHTSHSQQTPILLANGDSPTSPISLHTLNHSTPHVHSFYSPISLALPLTIYNLCAHSRPFHSPHTHTSLLVRIARPSLAPPLPPSSHRHAAAFTNCLLAVPPYEQRGNFLEGDIRSESGQGGERPQQLRSRQWVDERGGAREGK